MKSNDSIRPCHDDYHVMNRAVGRMRIFGKQRDFEAFEEVIEQTKVRLPMRVLTWCLWAYNRRYVLAVARGNRRP